MKRCLFSRSMTVLALLMVGVTLSITSPLVAISKAASYSIWPATVTPAVVAASDTGAVELGVKFRASSSGYITGIRFYKASTNTGTHIGNLWTESGTPLGSVTFTNETASGWQQQLFSAPVAISAGTTYVVSYHTNVGRYSYNAGYFATSGFDNSPLRALSNSEGGGNGVYRYGTNSGFPTQTWNSTNYWVDVIFEESLGSDTTPPTVTSVLPASGGVNVSTDSTVSATFSEDVDAATIGTNTFTLVDPSNAPVPATVSYNSATKTATLDPTALLSPSTTYRATLIGGSGGVKDVAGNPLAANQVWAFTTENGGTATSYSIWGDAAVPSILAANDSGAVELGLKFQSSVAGSITGILFYKGLGNTGTHVGNLWTETGTLLGSVTFTNETDSGWQYQALATTVAISANTTYVVSYFAPVGGYSADVGYFAGSGVDSYPLRALSNGESGGNGVYRYGSSSSFPNQTWNSTNYWVDVVFSPGGGSDASAPTVTAFTLPAKASALTVSITSFTATDNVSVTGYIVSESSTTPSATAGGWSSIAPTSYTFGTAGTKTLYAWAKDAAGNVSTNISASVTITLPDTTAPTVTAFTLPATASTLTVSITSFTATDNVGVTGYIISESSTTPSPTAGGWSATAPTSYTFASDGTKTLYAWAKDAGGNVSASRSASVTITLSDTSAPIVTAFTMPATATTLTVPITSFTATDNVAVTGYMVSESSTTPSPTAGGWSATAPTSYTFGTAGTKTLYAWAKDAAGNVSARKSASVTITVQSGGPEPAGWYAGDMHVHRSCGGSPESISSLYNKMSTQDLAVISLLADMGNGEVLDPVTDLPRVTGANDPVSTAGRIVHWDAEWHWDPVYYQFPHQALGGHVVALGLSDAEQIWEEYTYKIFEWAHQQNGIAGFAHMQYLDGGIPDYLNCCIPLEYPVEVALGAADFISEDVNGSDSAIEAYYKLLNCGFRPGFAAGTDYPCGVSELGSLLTYVQVEGGQMTYRNWIEGIAAGRTVVSRNGHNEFLDLKVNGSSTPGDEINLMGNASLPVTVTWKAKQNLSGSIELVHNGVVVASQASSVSQGAPATLSTSVSIDKSGWLAARRMSGGGHEVHTGAVFVIVNNAPIRASAADALFHVDWIDNLLEKTSSGGAWAGYFSSNATRDAAQARYRAAKAIYEQIALEAGETPPVEPPTEPPTGQTIFSTQVPSIYENDSAYELGTKFWTDVAGQITGVRLYTNAAEGGNHTVRIWRASDGALVAGPYTWNIASGTAGWKTLTLPTAVAITANTDYIVAVSNSSDRYYAGTLHGFDAPIVSGHLRTYVGSGVWTGTLGTMPTSIWENTNYFRDVLFVPNF